MFKEIITEVKNGLVKIPLYSAFLVSDEFQKKIEKLAGKKDFNDYYHVTVLFSRKPVKVEKKILNNKIPIEPFKAKVSGYEIFKSGDYNSFVLVLECKKCEEEFDKLMNKYKASYDYEEYIPHLTILYNFEGNPEEFFNKFKDMEIVFDKQVFEPFNDNKYKEE